MNRHIAMDEMDAFRRGQLPADELASVAAHLRECRECGSRWPAVERAAAALVTDLAELEHPDVEELFDYVDGKQSDEITQHLRDCEQCRADVADATRERDHVRQPLRLSRPGLTRQPERLSYVFLAAAAAIAIVIGGAWLLRHPVTPQTPPPIVHVTPPSQGEWDALIAEARQAHGVALPAIVRELRGDSESFRGEHESPSSMHLSPAGTVVVSRQPELSWRAAKGERYVVSLVCDGFAAKSEPVAGDRWTPARPLPRGARCVWQLERLSDHEIFPKPSAPQPAFRVLDDATLAAVDKAAAHGDELATALLYARAGVQKEAEAHLRTYIDTHPSDAAAPEILRSIEHW